MKVFCKSISCKARQGSNEKGHRSAVSFQRQLFRKKKSVIIYSFKEHLMEDDCFYYADFTRNRSSESRNKYIKDLNVIKESKIRIGLFFKRRLRANRRQQKRTVMPNLFRHLIPFVLTLSLVTCFSIWAYY